MPFHPALRTLYRGIPIAAVLKRPARNLYEAACRRSHDGFVLAHPNTGSTMITMALARYFQLRSDSSQFRFFHDNYWTLGRKEGFNCFSPFGKVSSTHLPHRIDSVPEDFTHKTCIAPYKHARIVLVIRNPLEALLSNWLHYASFAEEQLAIKMRRFFAGPLRRACFDSIVLGDHGLPSSVAYYNQFAAHRAKLRIKFIRFEDCKHSDESLRSTLTSVLEFLSDGLHTPDPHDVKASAQFSSIDNVKAQQSTGLLIDDAEKNMAEGYNIFRDTLPHQKEGYRGHYADYYLSASAKATALSYLNEKLDCYYGYVDGKISRSVG